MPSSMIERANWRRFAAEFSRQHEGWPLILEVTNEVSKDPSDLDSVPFHGMAIDDRTGVATLIMGDEPDHYFTHSVAGLRDVLLESTDDRSESTVRLESDDGTITVLHFELSDAGSVG